MTRVLIFIIALISALYAFGKESQAPDTLTVTAEVVQTVGTGEHTPFWLVSNRQGLSSISRDYGYVEVGAVKKMDENRRFSWGAGVDLVVPWKMTSGFVVQQLYGELKYRSLSLMLGSRNHEPALVDGELSSGELLYSGNARPIPQIYGGIREFQPLHFVNDWIGIKGFLSYGKFTDSSWQEHWAAPGSRYDKGAWVCSRGIWLKGGNEKKFPLVFNIGLEMATQFGGTIYNLNRYSDGKMIKDLKMSSGFKTWIKALIPMPGDDGTIDLERTNVEGNTVGTWNFSLEWKPDADWGVKAYWQHVFEDHSMMWIQFPWKDGLWGVQGWLPRNPFVSSVVYEFMCSKFQSGPVYNDWTQWVPEQVSGVDRYYNHELYSGWMHWGMALGNPFFISPVYNPNHILEFYATRNVTHHIGIKGNPADGVDWRLLLSHSKSWGDYWKPFPEVRSMWNFMAEVKWRPVKLRQLECRAAVAFDRGDLVGDNFGVMLGIRYDLPVTLKK